MADLMPVWLTYCPYDGWEEHATRAEAETWLDGIVDMLREEARHEDGWHEAAEDARLVEARVVRRLELRVTARAEDDTADGEWCRSEGWGSIVEGVSEATEIAEAALARARARPRPDLTSEIDLGTGDSTPLREVESDEEYARRHGWGQDLFGIWTAPGGPRADGWWRSHTADAVIWRDAVTRAVVPAPTLRAAVDEWRRIRAEETDRGEPEPDRGEVDDEGPQPPGPEPAGRMHFQGGAVVYRAPGDHVRIVLASVDAVDVTVGDRPWVTVYTRSRAWRLVAPDPRAARVWCEQIAGQAARARGGDR